MPAALSNPLVAQEVGAKLTLHKLWETPDADAALKELAPRIRGILAGAPGHRRVGGEFLGQFPNLEIVSSFGVGYDHIDAKWAAAHGVVVTNTPDVLNEEVADTAMGLLLSTLRQLPQAERYLRAGKWQQANFPLSDSLQGRTMGILGLGRIGKAIARRAEAFGVKIAYHGRSRQPDVPYPYYATVLEMAAAVDILMVIAPGGPSTKHLVDAAVLRALGPRGVLINVARGSLVDEDALVAALQKGEIMSAGLDVFAHEPQVPQALLDMDHVVLLPHVGSASHRTRDAMAHLVAENMLSYAAGKGPLTPVAETPWPRLEKAD
ncbi:2-hydroxyacid dehydrogenase [Methylovirgula sp. 4M-Z18]|uniref:2-hydroxyacid dehydrogenase n=1 Tax=Methylovirgula sp. 4M-Z18 TaxID=2293567 RepID=UPI001FE0CC3A|nr:2-hydroxyacid dehydrogenase [Methylovirgula sp. 4M-Z18]